MHGGSRSVVRASVLGLFGLVISFGGNAAADVTSVPRPDHIVVVVEENHSATNILGNPDAPYINDLARQNANFTQSFAVTHPSQPNYLALFSGTTQGVTNDNCPHSFTAPSMADQLIAAGKTFVGYSESLPSQGFTGCTSGKYAAKHSPWINFPSLPSSTNQPLTAFPTDFNNLPDVSYVIPNLDNDMHDGTVAQGDAWLQTHLGDYISWAKTHNSLFVLTFDEDDNNNGNLIPTIMVGQRVTPGTYTETINHYDMLRTIQDAFGLAPLGNSAAAHPILNVWNADGGSQLPMARFTSSCTKLRCSFDASSSTATGGATVTGYLWDFGDGNTSTQAAPIHTYAADGTYDVRLTVTDSLGSTSSATTKSVTVKALDVFAADAFGRTVGTGWGAADVGGSWTGTTGFSVAGGVGLASVPVNASRITALPVSVGDATTTFSVGVDKRVAGGTAQVQYALHRSSAGEYRLKLRYLSTGEVSVWLIKKVGSTETLLVDAGNVSGYTQTAGSRLNVKVDSVTTGGSTTLRTKVWPAGTGEPAGWMATATDSLAALQAAGEIDLSGYVPGSVTNGPLEFSFDDLNVSGQAGTHAAPVAGFTHTESGLTSTFDSSSTTTSDNATITGYAWDFGDGSNGTQASPNHKYADAGTYQVSLVVTDSRGSQSQPVSKLVTVTGTSLDVFAADAFGRTVGSGWGAADVGGSWTGTTGFSVAGGVGLASVPVNASRITALPVSVGDADDHVQCRCGQAGRRWHCAGSVRVAPVVCG